MTDGLALLLGPHGLGAADLLQLWAHFLMLSLLAVGGAISTAPEMQRYLVDQQGWLSPAEFGASIAIAQAAPGPNILFVALMGWHTAGLWGLLATMSGILLPSSILAVAAGRYAQRQAHTRPVRAFVAGLAPLTLGLMLSTGWLLTAADRQRWPVPLLVLATVWLTLRSKTSPLWLIAGGAVVGMLTLA